MTEQHLKVKNPDPPAIKTHPKKIFFWQYFGLNLGKPVLK
jgi:hypothetical protein